MTTPVMPRFPVDAPAAGLPAPHNLFTASTVLDDVPRHALMGVQYETVCSAQVDGYPAPCEPGTDTLEHTKTPADTTDVVTGTPFAVYAADECVLGRDEATARRQLRTRFGNGEAAAVERIVASGSMANWPNLTVQPTVVAAGSSADLVDAVGLAEQWLADQTGSPGVIHAPRTIGPRAYEQHQVVKSGPRASTRLGSTWVFGTGYTGQPPTGETDDGSLWLYATPQITVRRSTVETPATWETGAFNRAENAALLLVERMYVVDWSCGVAAIKTTLPRPGYVAAA